jgi:AcrR family transcriptional regulator
MAMKRTDRRVARSRRLLQDALIALLSRKSFDSVTIQEILDEADLGRATFYAHFTNKEELLQSCFDGVTSLLARRTVELTEAVDDQSRSPDPGLSLDLFSFVETHATLFTSLLSPSAGGAFSAPLHDYLLPHARDHLRLMVPELLHRHRLLDSTAEYFVGALIGMLYWWVGTGMTESATTMEQRWNRLAFPSIQLLIDG